MVNLKFMRFATPDIILKLFFFFSFFFSNSHSKNWHLESIQIVLPRIEGFLIINALGIGGIVFEVGTKGPATDLLLLSRGLDSTIQSLGFDTILHPINKSRQSGLRPGSIGLESISTTVGASGNKEQTVPIIQLSYTLVVGEMRVHNTSGGLVVADRTSSRNLRVRLTVIVKDFASNLLPDGKIWPCGLERIIVPLETSCDPITECVTGDSLEAGEGGDIGQKV